MTQINNSTSINITLGTIVKAVLVIIGFYFIYLLSDIVLALVTSVILASAIEPFAQWLTRRKIPRTIAVLVLYVSMLVTMAGIMYFFIPAIIQDMKGLFNQVPTYINTLSTKATLLNDIPAFNQFTDQLLTTLKSESFFQTAGSGVASATVGVFSVASSFFGGILSLILIIVFSFYLSVQEDGVSNFLRIVTPIQHEKYVLDLWKRSRRKIGLWMQGQLLLGVLVGILTYLGLSILGVENALFLALIAALFELIPVFGPILSSIPAIAIAIPQGGLTLTLLVIGLYLIIQQFENHLIHPLVVKKIVGIPALIAILALIVGAKLAGLIGIIIAVPVTAAIMEYIQDLEKRKLELMKNNE